MASEGKPKLPVRDTASIRLLMRRPKLPVRDTASIRLLMRFDRFSIASECNRFGLDFDLIRRACDPEWRELPGHFKAVDELSLKLLDALIERDDLERSGGSHPVRVHAQIPDSLINELALSMAECGWICKQEWSLPLAILLRHQLGAIGKGSGKKNR